MLIALQQVVEDQSVNPRRLRVQPDARIEIGWTALNDHHQCFRIGGLGAGE